MEKNIKPIEQKVVRLINKGEHKMAKKKFDMLDAIRLVIKMNDSPCPVCGTTEGFHIPISNYGKNQEIKEYFSKEVWDALYNYMGEVHLAVLHSLIVDVAKHNPEVQKILNELKEARRGGSIK